jgi:hypothetical protein
LRPIGITVRDIASRTGALLGELINIPNILIFHGVRTPGANTPLVAHAVAAGRTLILVESVAWPPGRYRTDASGRIICDGLYIGQSVGTLLAAVQDWRRTLPRHRVSAMVVVHPTNGRHPSLPANEGAELTWVGADTVVNDLEQRMPQGKNISYRSLAALIAATTPD